MKIPLIFFFNTLLFFSFAHSGYQIRIKTENIHADSIYIKSYNIKNKKFTNLLASKFENDITFKNKIPLLSGIYIVEVDSVIVSEFLISDDQNQKFTISVLDNDIIIEGSKENSANRSYMKQMLLFDKQLQALDVEFKQMQQRGLPNYMMQPFVDTLAAKTNIIFAEKKAYQEKIIAENKGLLLASIIQSSMDAPQPPQEYYRDQMKLLAYISEHLFDTFPWEDERLLNTHILYNKLKTFAQQLYMLESKMAVPIVTKVLNESKKNRSMYYVLYDYLEHELGYYKSPYRDEELYIAMLNDILALTDLDETHELRRDYYEHELALISKNQRGSIAPDFNILLSTGDTTTMYNIESELLMLYFQNPDCPTCGELREKMKNMEILNHAIASGKLKIVTIYFEKNEELWRNYLQKRAIQNWVHGWNYDLKIEDDRLYDIRFIPMIMFLDKNKKVIKKDLLSNEIEDWLKKYL